MQRELIVKSKTLGGSSDLTLLATIKPGLVPSLESITYKTRTKRVLEALHGMRQSAHEHALARLLSDAVERVGVIQSVRVAVFEPENEILLSVTFDGPWQAYIRSLWSKVGTLLDLIFCNAEGYPLAFESSFDVWLTWVNSVQRETGFFYGSPEFTAKDSLYQRRIERMRERGQTEVVSELRSVLPPAEELVRRTLDARKGNHADDPAINWDNDSSTARGRMLRQRMQTGLRGLSGMYRLAEMYPLKLPGGKLIADGEVMRRAALDLLAEFTQLRQTLPKEWGDYENGVKTKRFVRPLKWLGVGDPPKKGEFPNPSGDSTDRLIAAPDQGDGANIQGGILRPYVQVTHGLAVLVSFQSRQIASDFFAAFVTSVRKHSQDHDARTAGSPFINIGLTPAGLRQAGLSEDDMALFPVEFLQGMAARAGLLGDVRHNHPLRWQLPDLLGADGTPTSPGQKVDLNAAHALLIWRCNSDQPLTTDWTDTHPLRQALSEFCQTYRGVSILALQPLVEREKDHFGYKHGMGQPQFADEPVTSKPKYSRNTIHYGEVVHGFDNAADMASAKPQPAMEWLRHGSFLVARKYTLYPDRLDRAVKTAASEMKAQLDGAEAQALIYAKLMGRGRNGTPLLPSGIHTDPTPDTNNFSFALDEEGSACPLHAHIRLANPRLAPEAGKRLPRIMRRGMSIGPEWHAEPPGALAAGCGVLFLAYNADISEQFEVIQRWLTGANSTGSSSGQSCPFMGVPDNGMSRNFRFEYAAEKLPDGYFADARNVQLEKPTSLFNPPEALTELNWGLYLFAPSIAVLEKLGKLKRPSPQPAWSLADGIKQLENLERETASMSKEDAIQTWKAALEDPDAIDSHRASALWAAIRDKKGGYLETQYGTLIANSDLLNQVLNDVNGYSVCGQEALMNQFLGKIALGMDAGPIYDQESKPINDAIMALTDKDAKKEDIFSLAFDAAAGKITQIIEDALDDPATEEERFDTSFDVREIVEEVVANLSEHWFGLHEAKGLFERGGGDLSWTDTEVPLYPGHFTALSRLLFQPRPNPEVVEPLAIANGKALKKNMADFVRLVVASGKKPCGNDERPAVLFSAIYDHPSKCQDSDPVDFVARNVVGVLMGFSPTIIGAVINVVREWQRDGVFAQVQAQLAGRTDRLAAHSVLFSPMVTAAQARPMPQIAWRTATAARKPLTCPHSGKEFHVPKSDDNDNDKPIPVVLSLVSGTQELWAKDDPDLMLMFAGTRRSNPAHPTHACPGYEAAIEAMLGCLTAMVSLTHINPKTGKSFSKKLMDVGVTSTATSLSLRPSVGWLNFQITGTRETKEVNPSPKKVPEKVGFFAQLVEGVASLPQRAWEIVDKKRVRTPDQFLDLERQFRTGIRASNLLAQKEIAIARQSLDRALSNSIPGGLPLGERSGLILAWGDSWLDYEYTYLTLGQDIRDALQSFGYNIPANYCNWTEWKYVSTMANNTAPFCEVVREAVESGNTPKAILLSAGGNDIVEDPLEKILKNVTDVDWYKQGIGPDTLDTLIGTIEEHYGTIVGDVVNVLEATGTQKPIPIFIHSYAVPFPDFEIPLLPIPITKKWLWTPFANRGYDLTRAEHKAWAREAAKVLLASFTAMQDQVALMHVHPLFPVVRVNAAKVLPGVDSPDYREIWNDPMHLKSEYFARVALEIDKMIQNPVG